MIGRMAERETALPHVRLYKRLIGLLSLGLVTILLTQSVVLAYNIRSTLDQNSDAAQRQYLRQIIVAYEMVYTLIESSLSQCANSQALTEFVQASDRYETLRPPYGAVTLRGLASYLLKKKNVYDQMVLQLSVSDYILSVTLYDVKKDLILSTGEASKRLSEFRDEDFVRQVLTGSRTYYYNRMTRSIHRVEQRLTHSVVKVFGVDREALLYYDIDAERLHQATIADMLLEGSALVVASQDQILVGRSGTLSPQELETLRSDYDRQIFTFDDKRVVAAHSDKLGLSFYLIQPPLQGSLGALEPVLIGLALLTLTLLLTLALFILRGAYRPLDEVMRQLGRIAPVSLEGARPRADRSGKLRASIDEAMTLYEREMSRYRKLLPSYQRLLLEEALSGGGAEAEALTAMLRDIHPDLAQPPEGGRLALMLLRVRVEDVAQRDKALSAAHLIASQTLSNHLRHGQSLATAVLSNSLIALLFVSDEEEFPRLFTYANTVSVLAHEVTEANALVGIAPLAAPRELPEYAAKLQDLLLYRTDWSETVLYLGDAAMGAERRKLPRYPYEMENALRAQLLQGEEEAALRCYYGMLESLGPSDQPPLYVRSFFDRLAGMLLDVINELDAACFDCVEGIQQAARNGQVQEAVLQTEKLARRLCGEASDRSEASRNAYVSAILRIMEERLDQPLSLDTFGDLLGISPAYVSQIVKKHTGKTFTAMLVDLRMERAKSLLRDTNEPIADIAAATGYANSNYFIRVFRENAGITPGHFRKLCRTQPDVPL